MESIKSLVNALKGKAGKYDLTEGSNKVVASINKASLGATRSKRRSASKRSKTGGRRTRRRKHRHTRKCKH
jgi:hypothetical protein